MGGWGGGIRHGPGQTSHDSKQALTHQRIRRTIPGVCLGVLCLGCGVWGVRVLCGVSSVVVYVSGGQLARYAFSWVYFIKGYNELITI